MRHVLFVAALAVASTCAHADMPGADWMTQEQVVRKLESLGYSNVMKLEADDGHWEGDATKNGTTFEIHVDPHTGKITKDEPKDNDD